jgi:hypothetical protein
VEISIQGLLFVITPGTSVPVDPEDEVTLPALPSTERNPFVPIGQ